MGIFSDTLYENVSSRDVDRMGRLALISAQKCLLSLGDLARYREQVLLYFTVVIVQGVSEKTNHSCKPKT